MWVIQQVLLGYKDIAANIRAIFWYWENPAILSMTNLVSNTWVVSTDTTWVWTARSALAWAGYGA